MSNIKSAMEIAMEKVARLGTPSEDERLKWKHVPAGEQLAARYLKEDYNLIAELSQYQPDVRKYIVTGAAGILIRNIDIPKHDAARKNNKRAMDGLKILKSDKVGVENVYSRIRQLFKHYAEQGEQQRRQAYQSLKTEMEGKMQQAMQQQMDILPGTRIDVEKQPQFQQEWRKVQAQFDSQYLTILGEYKRELSGIA